MAPFTVDYDTAAADLANHFDRHGNPARLSIDNILSLESAGSIVDLETGRIFTPMVDYIDFARRWAAYRRHVGRPLDAAGLCRALMAAFDNPFDYGPDLWQSIAHKAIAVCA